MEQMILAADDYNAGPPGPTTSREKRSLPDDDDGSDSVEENNESDPSNHWGQTPIYPGG